MKKISKMLLAKNYFYVFISLSIISIAGCSQKPEVIHDLSQKDYTLINQDSSVVRFPGDYKGKTVVLGFIYANCPDICPMTTNNIKLVKDELDKKGVNDVTYVDISFDPERDSPSVLKQFADVRGINTDNFHFLTGSKDVIKSLLKDVNVLAIPGDTTVIGGDTAYYFIHTDRISVMDPEGKIRSEFKGSTANREELIKDINKIR
ncbi:MAG: SCO family protein [Melioribacteraceae bacterium]